MLISEEPSNIKYNCAKRRTGLLFDLFDRLCHYVSEYSKLTNNVSIIYYRYT